MSHFFDEPDAGSAKKMRQNRNPGADPDRGVTARYRGSQPGRCERTTLCHPGPHPEASAHPRWVDCEADIQWARRSLGPSFETPDRSRSKIAGDLRSPSPRNDLTGGTGKHCQGHTNGASRVDPTPDRGRRVIGQDKSVREYGPATAPPPHWSRYSMLNRNHAA
ncbi:hypothetical protein Maq22A_c27870 [Methylobacterium aquaticum]|uniref:Uncharacterized protein n=1 Tax=Methylobacterium aquaticum TaxID=270351 RepID=A0A1Y0ZBP8_9HYPH|nr:hypothetical protein Maq22A_c27870 [Methylobacterium aquaticum]